MHLCHMNYIHPVIWVYFICVHICVLCCVMYRCNKSRVIFCVVWGKPRVVCMPNFKALVALKVEPTLNSKSSHNANFIVTVLVSGVVVMTTSGASSDDKWQNHDFYCLKYKKLHWGLQLLYCIREPFVTFLMQIWNLCKTLPKPIMTITAIPHVLWWRSLPSPFGIMCLVCRMWLIDVIVTMLGNMRLGKFLQVVTKFMLL